MNVTDRTYPQVYGIKDTVAIFNQLLNFFLFSVKMKIILSLHRRTQQHTAKVLHRSTYVSLLHRTT